MSRGHALFLSYDGLTDPLGGSQIIPYLKGLKDCGYRISVISCDKPDRFAQYGEALAAELLEAGLNWISVPYTKSPPILSTIKDVRALRTAAQSLLESDDPPQIIHARSYIAGLVASGLKHRYSFRFLFDIRGFWVDERVEGRIWNLSNPVFRLVYTYFRRAEKGMFRSADHVISLTSNGADAIRDFSWLKEPPVTVIPCCVDMEHFDRSRLNEASRKSRRKALGLNGEGVITYLGSIGTWYMLDEMLDYFKEHLKVFPRSQFLFITPDSPEHLRAAAAAKGIDAELIKVISATRNEVPELLSLADFSIFFIRPTFSKRASSPTKMGEIMAMGIPIIANSGVGDVDGLMKKWNCGVLCEQFEAADYYQAAQQLQEIRFNADEIRVQAGDFYALSRGVSLYDDVYQTLLANNS